MSTGQEVHTTYRASPRIAASAWTAGQSDVEYGITCAFYPTGEGA